MPTRNEPASDAGWHSVWIGLGGNIGDVRANMASALLEMDQDAQIRVMAVSRLYRTPPWGEQNQPDFLNACATIYTSQSPDVLIRFVKDIEKSMKRHKTTRWGPRNIDIDLLIYEGETRDSDGLKLPHPRMAQRAFVLVPLAEIAPELLYSGKTITEWAHTSDRTGLEPVTDDGNWWLEKT